MYLKAETDRVFQLLSNSRALSDVTVIRAYPYVKKPLRLKTPVLCVSPSGINADRASLGGEYFFGEYGVDIDLFSPHCLGSPVAERLLETVAALVCGTGVSAFRFGGLKNDNAIDCFTAKCTAVYRSALQFTEEGLWTAQQTP